MLFQIRYELSNLPRHIKISIKKTTSKQHQTPKVRRSWRVLACERHEENQGRIQFRHWSFVLRHSEDRSQVGRAVLCAPFLGRAARTGVRALPISVRNISNSTRRADSDKNTGSCCS